jgi:hypothetical protein
MWTLFVILLAGWGVGVIAGDSFGGAIHLLLLGAIVLLLWKTLSSGQRVRD